MSAATSEDGRRTDLARALHRRCVEAAERAWEEAGAAGLCAEGRWELVLAALRAVDPAAVVQEEPEDPAG